MGKFSSGDGSSEEDFESGGKPESSESVESKGDETPRASEPTQELIADIESAFESFTVSEVDVDGMKISMVGLDELPMERLMRMAHADGKRQVMIMREYIKLCLVNPTQWDSLETLNFEQFTNFVRDWIVGSKGIPLMEQEEDFEDDE
jgi:hypothetical protein